MNEAERRRRLEELLKPNGQPLGVPARIGSRVRRVPGAPVDAMVLFEELRALGQGSHVQSYPGTRVGIPGLGYVGLRMASKSGETALDVRVSIDGLRNVKFKYVGRQA